MRRIPGGWLLGLATLATLAAATVLSLGAAPPPPAREALAGGEACARAKAAWLAQVRAHPGVERSQASPNFDATYYGLDLGIDFAAERIDGTVRVEGRAVGSPLSTLDLDLADSMVVSSVRSAGGTDLSYTHANDVLSIALAATVPVDSMVAVDVTYGGHPQTTGLGSFTFGTRGAFPFAWSLSEPYGARDWWPCKDHPSDKADSVRVSVTVPDGTTVGSQGLLESTVSAGGKTTFTWRSRYRITSYLVSIAAGHYAEYDTTYQRPDSLAASYGPLDMPIIQYRYEDGTPELPAAWKVVNDAIGVFESWYGPYPFAAEKYGQAEFTFGGGMEHQTMGSLGASVISLVTHELAHQWFGDAISPRRWPDVWLNEGFATYSELLFWQARAALYPNLYNVALHNLMSDARYTQGTVIVADTSATNELFAYDKVYAKGAMVLHMLRHVVGDTTFAHIMRTYAQDPSLRYGNATTADFVRVAETVSGLDLGTFFRQWVTHGTGYPRYGVDSWSEPSGAGYRVYVTVAQQQTPGESNVPVFVMPVTIAVTTTTGEERFTVRDDQRWQRFAFDVSGRPTQVTFDPDLDILRAEGGGESPRVVPPKLEILAVSPNPFAGTAQVDLVLPKDGEVRATLYDVAGHRVRVVHDAAMGRGPQRMTLDADGLASGVYFLRVEGFPGEAVRKVMVVR